MFQSGCSCGSMDIHITVGLFMLQSDLAFHFSVWLFIFQYDCSYLFILQYGCIKMTCLFVHELIVEILSRYA